MRCLLWLSSSNILFFYILCSLSKWRRKTVRIACGSHRGVLNGARSNSEPRILAGSWQSCLPQWSDQTSARRRFTSHRWRTGMRTCLLPSENLNLPTLHLQWNSKNIVKRRRTVLNGGETQQSIVFFQVDSVQALGGTGALRVGMDFLRSRLCCDTVYVSSPTWGG